MLLRPSELQQRRVQHALPAGTTLTVAGRLLWQHETHLLLADALARCDVQLRCAPDPQLQLGQWVCVQGQLQGDQLSEAKVLHTYPGQYRHDGEMARFGRIAKTLHAAARARRAVRTHLDGLGFVEVFTPLRVVSPGTDVYITPHRTADGWLITSPEFHMKRMVVGGMGHVYQFATCTRDEERGAWHQPEFTLLEWYRSFADVHAVMRDTEQIVELVFAEAAPTPHPSKHSCTVQGPHGSVTLDVRAPFERISVRDAFAQFADIRDASDLAASNEALYFELLVNQVEPALARFERPLFLTDYPATQAALAQKNPADPSVAERFELYLGGVELCNGYGELTCAVEQRARFENDRQARQSKGLPDIEIDEAFLQALHEGLPPTAGNALGFERLLAVALQQPLADVIAFPWR